MSNAPIDLKKLASQTVNDLVVFAGEDLEEQILYMALHAAYRAGVEHGTEHGWHERQDQIDAIKYSMEQYKGALKGLADRDKGFGTLTDQMERYRQDEEC